MYSNIKRVTLCLNLFLVASLLYWACNKAPKTGVTSQPDSETNISHDTCSVKDMFSPPAGSVIIYNDVVNGRQRVIYICQVTDEEKKIYVYDEGGKQQELHIGDADDMYYDGLPYSVGYALSPKKDLLYLVVDSGSCGAMGVLCGEILFQINVRTLESKWIASCANVACNKDCIVITKGDVTNKQIATCEADYEYEFYYEICNWDGVLQRTTHQELEWIDENKKGFRIVN